MKRFSKRPAFLSPRRSLVQTKKSLSQRKSTRLVMQTTDESFILKINKCNVCAMSENKLVKTIMDAATLPGLAERLFGYQYAVEMLLPSGQRSTACVKRLLDVVVALNNEVTRLTGKKSAVAIKEKAVSANPSTPYSKLVGVNEESSPPISMLAISTSLVKSKVGLKELQTKSDL